MPARYRATGTPFPRPTSIRLPTVHSPNGSGTLPQRLRYDVSASTHFVRESPVA